MPAALPDLLRARGETERWLLHLVCPGGHEVNDKCQAGQDPGDGQPARWHQIRHTLNFATRAAALPH